MNKITQSLAPWLMALALYFASDHVELKTVVICATMAIILAVQNK
jgi:hypothetical protein